MKTDWKTGFLYWFVHFSVEVICFYTVYCLFKDTRYWWGVALLYDALAFAPQAAIGAFFEKHRNFAPGPLGCGMLIAGALLMLGSNRFLTAETLVLILQIIGFILLTIGNGFVHIAGAFVTLRVSEGRLAESAVFVGGGSFGVITGRLLSSKPGLWWIPILLMIAALLVSIAVDKDVKKRYSTNAHERDFINSPCLHNIAAERSTWLVIMILGLVVVVRAYIGYGLPTAWNKTTVQTICLFVFMGIGKMSGGILSDIFGARKVGIISCLLAIPLLLVSNNIMWLSLIAVALFSMTMAITLGGLVSVLPSYPGIAFGVTTLGLFLGTAPTFIWGMPEQTICNILITVMSVLAAMGLGYCLKKNDGDKVL